VVRTWLGVYQTSAGRGIAADSLGYLYVVGFFEGSVVFGKHMLAADAGSSDMFLIKLKPPPPPSP
jgi:Beta-propeller repeat